ncbi:hypothetical protein BLOT_008963 [Blomia tropicalis]|nr:hypothetical protein BLOT_008963 [Blomia tropicalis]
MNCCGFVSNGDGLRCDKLTLKIQARIAFTSLYTEKNNVPMHYVCVEEGWWREKLLTVLSLSTKQNSFRRIVSFPMTLQIVAKTIRYDLDVLVGGAEQPSASSSSSSRFN